MVGKGEMIEWIDRHATAITFAVAILVSVFLVFLGFYEALWLAALPNGSSYGEIIRNYGLIVVAFWAASLAVWRSRIATRQVAEQRNATSLDRFYKAVKMLQSDHAPTQQVGILIMFRIAQDKNNAYRQDALDMISEVMRSYNSA